MINAAIIGVSGFGEVHYQDLLRYHEAGRLRIIGATIINPGEEQEKCRILQLLGCRIFPDYREMFEVMNSQIDLCFIPTGIGLHCEMALCAMRHGASVLIEKPAAPTIQEVERMRQAEKETGRFVAVGYQSIFQPEIHRIKQDIVNGAIGRVRRIKGIGLCPRDHRYYSRNNWAGKMSAAGGWILDSPFNNALAHYLNLICFFGGDGFKQAIEPAFVEAQLYRCNPEIEAPDTAVIHAEGKNGIDLWFYCSHCPENYYRPEIHVCGDDGSIIYNPERILFQFPERSEVLLCDTSITVRNHLLDALIKRIGDPGAFICDLGIAGKQVLLMNGAHESSPVMAIPSEYTSKVPMDGDNYRYILPGLDEWFLEHFRKAQMLAGTDYPWVRQGLKIPLVGYRQFCDGRN